MPAGIHEAFVNVGGVKIRLLKSGSGVPLLVLHGTEGSLGWRHYIQSLAEHFTVYLPSHPGFDGSERPTWLNSIFDLVCFYTWFLETQGLEGTRVIGWSLGGWLAAEMAATTRHAFSKMLLVDAAGIRPHQGEIIDLFILSPAQIRDLTFHDPQQVPEYAQLYPSDPSPAEREQAVQNREMAVRLTWKPYMHDPRLPALLARVTAPTRIVWGRQDKIIPVECGTLHHQAIPGSELVVIEQCGHAPHLEKPDEFVRVALDFLP
jgi:pimeloyl-ACP methyl ester carboxylesterase